MLESGDYTGMTETKLGRDDEEFSSFRVSFLGVIAKYCVWYSQ